MDRLSICAYYLKLFKGTRCLTNSEIFEKDGFGLGIDAYQIPTEDTDLFKLFFIQSRVVLYQAPALLISGFPIDFYLKHIYNFRILICTVLY